MTDPMQAEREAFEAWFEPNEHNRAAIRAWRSGDGYREGGYYLCGCWNGWQAHAEHIASELRSLRDALDLARSHIGELREALEEILGVEVMAPEGGHEEVNLIHGIARAALKASAGGKEG